MRMQAGVRELQPDMTTLLSSPFSEYVFMQRALVKTGNPPALLGRLTEFDSSGNLMVSPRCEPPSITRRRNHERDSQFKPYPLGM